MADRPRNGGPEDGPDFTWLYGKKRSEPRPDDTRMIPQQPRPQPGAPREPRSSTPPHPSSLAPTPGATPADRTSGGSRFRRPRFWIRTVLGLFVLWLVFLLVVPFFAWTRVDKVEFAPEGDRPDNQPGTTYLLVGSDSRQDLTPAQRREFGTGNPGGQRTDTILLLHTGSGPNLLMSIPRDSLVDVPGYGGESDKINAAFAVGGAPLLVRTIENETGIRVDQYVEIGFGGFVDIVDAVDGIEICPESAIDDPLAKLKVKKGCQDVEGATALGYARSRKTYAAGDIQRATAQREVISAIGRKVISPWSVLNPFRYWGLNMAATQAASFGEGTNPVRAAMFASAMTNVDGESGLTCGVPISDLAVNWDPERSQRMFEAIINDETDTIGRGLCSPSGLPQ